MNKLVTSAQFQLAWSELGTLPDDLLKPLIDRLAQEQPMIFAYVMSRASNDPEGETLNRSAILALGLVLFDLLCQADRPPITEDEIEAAEDINAALGEKMGDDLADHLFSNHPQKTLVAEVVSLLSEVSTEEPGTSAEDTFSRDVLVMLTVIDLLS